MAKWIRTSPNLSELLSWEVGKESSRVENFHNQSEAAGFSSKPAGADRAQSVGSPNRDLRRSLLLDTIGRYTTFLRVQ